MSSPFVPNDPIDVSLGILNKGMVRNIATTALPEGSVYTAKNFHVETDGLTKRSGSINFAGGATVLYAPARDVIQLWKTDGIQKIGVIDTRFLYSVSGSSLSRQGYSYSTGTIKTSAALVRGSSTNWTASNIKADDYILLKPGVSQQEIRISQVNNKSLLTLASTPSPGPYASGTAYRIYRSFSYSKTYFVDWTTCDNKLVLADGGRPLFSWDGTTLGAFSSPLTFIPKCVCYFQDRLFCGNTTEGSYRYRWRIRWSKITDHTSFIASPDVQWLDRPYSPGELLRLVPMGKLLIAYYRDRVEIGRPTNIAGDLLPVSFEQVSTGGSGLVGMKAVVPFYDGHFLMMDDNVYFFSNSGFQPIGDPIWKEMTKGLKTLQGVYAAVDWNNDCVMFGIPQDLGQITKLWIYNYKSKSWSYDEVTCDMIGSISQATAYTIDGSVGTIDSQTDRFDDLQSSFFKYLAFSQGGALALFTPGVGDDYNGNPVEAVFETGDYEFGLPNGIKTVFEMSIKTDRLLSSDTTFVVQGSTNRGLDWKSLGNLVIHQNEDESDVSFKLTGSMIRFRVTIGSITPPFKVTEIILHLAKRGREIRFTPKD
jgi:hypothetical protein